MLWPTHENPEAVFRYTLSQLRRVLELPTDKDGTFLIATTETVCLNPKTVVIDVNEFEEWLFRANETNHLPEKRLFLEKAVARYTGNLVPYIDDFEIVARRALLDHQYQEALKQLIAICFNDRDFVSATMWTQKIIDLDPENVQGYTWLVQLYDERKDIPQARIYLNTLDTLLARQGRPLPKVLAPIAVRIRLHKENISVGTEIAHSNLNPLLTASSMPPSIHDEQANLPNKQYSSSPDNSPELARAMELREIGDLQAAEERVSALLSRSDLDISVHIQALLLLSNILRDRSENETALERAEEALRQAKIHELPELAAQAQVKMGLICHRIGQPKQALTLADEALTDAYNNGWPQVQIDALSLKAYLLENAGQRQEALSQFALALKVSKDTNNIRGQITVLADIARIHSMIGAHPVALENLEQSTRLARQAGLTRLVYTNEHREAAIYSAMGARYEAKMRWEALLPLVHEHHIRFLEEEIVHGLARLALSEKAYSEALALLREAEDLAQQFTMERAVTFIRLDRAYTHAALREYKASWSLYKDIWKELQPLHLAHMEFLSRLAGDLPPLVSGEQGAILRGLTERIREVQQPIGLYETTRRLELETAQQAILHEATEIMTALFAMPINLPEERIS